ncbi:MAG: hypothetical protein ACYC8T_31775, partial [Myxococcaceae bacterium]
EVTVMEGATAAWTRGGRGGGVGKVVYQQSAGYSVFEGKKFANEAQRVLEAGRTYQMRGALWMYFTFLDDAVDDNSGALQIEIAPLTGSGGMGRGLLPRP